MQFRVTDWPGISFVVSGLTLNPETPWMTAFSDMRKQRTDSIFGASVLMG
jgi:hypothetical protein